jgi:uroporphyrinogen-III synthase
VVQAPLLQVAIVEPREFPPLDSPDWVILVSSNAAEGLARALALPGFPALDPARTRFAAVGRRTAEAARAQGWAVSLVPQDERAGGLIEGLASVSLAGTRVWIPSGSREGSATRELPDYFRQEGARVSVIGVYENRVRTLDADDERALQAARPGAVLLHSPSAGEALSAHLDNPVVRRWWEAASLLAIGPVTARRLEALGASAVAICEEPSDEGVIAALGRLEVFRSARSQS